MDIIGEISLQILNSLESFIVFNNRLDTTDCKQSRKNNLLFLVSLRTKKLMNNENATHETHHRIFRINE